MHISQISNTNFNGRFIKTPALEQALKQADHNTLERFNGVVERALKASDNTIYKIESFEHTPMRAGVKVYAATYQLTKTDKTSSIPQFLASQDIKYYTFDKPEFVQKEESKILKNFVPVLEHLYPAKSGMTREEILDKITKNLI